MKVEKFIGVGENIHCTRIYKVGGKFCVESDGRFIIKYNSSDGPSGLIVPDNFVGDSNWEAGKVKHCAVAIWQGNYGDEAGKQSGVDYLQSLARRQEAAGASYLDINVDEFSTDVAQRVELMKWTVGVVQQACSLPVSVDSSNIEILKAGLEVTDSDRDRPMVNSVSLERVDAIAVAAEHNAVVIASAVGDADLPQTCEERMANFARLTTILSEAGLSGSDLHFDPLVFPISTDGGNGVRFLDTVKAIRETYGSEVHIVAGLSNVSFGMPNRKLINQVYALMAVEAGADGGIVDPMQINAEILSAVDEDGEAVKLARALLTGEDSFGMEYIAASRDGRV